MSDRIIRCGSIPEVAVLTTTIVNLSKSVKPERAEEIQAEIDLATGGLLYSDITEQQIQDLIDNKAASDLLTVKRSIIDYAVGVERDEFNTIVDGAKVTYDGIVNPARDKFNVAVSWLTSYNLSNHTEAEIGAYASGILNSEMAYHLGKAVFQKVV